MSKFILDDVWSMYTISPDPASGTPTLRDTCAALLSYTLSSSDIIPGSAGFTLLPRLTNPLRQSISDLKRLTAALGQPHIVDTVDYHIALGPTSPDWKVFLAWGRLVKQLMAAMKLVETSCAPPEPYHFATPPSRMHVRPSALPQANAGSWWIAPATPYKSSKSFFAEMSKASGMTLTKMSIGTSVDSEPNILLKLACGPMGNVGNTFIRKFPDAPASLRALRAAPSPLHITSSVHTRPAESVPRRNVPSRQASHAVEEVVNNGTTCHAEAAPDNSCIIPAKGLSNALPPAFPLASTMAMRKETARTARAEYASRREVPSRLADRFVEEVLDRTTCRAESASVNGGATLGKGLVDIKEVGSPRTHDTGNVSSPTVSDWHATARPPSAPSSDSAATWRSSRIISPASSSTSWCSRDGAVPAQTTWKGAQRQAKGSVLDYAKAGHMGREISRVRKVPLGGHTSSELRTDNPPQNNVGTRTVAQTVTGGGISTAGIDKKYGLTTRACNGEHAPSQRTDVTFLCDVREGALAPMKESATGSRELRECLLACSSDEGTKEDDAARCGMDMELPNKESVSIARDMHLERLTNALAAHSASRSAIAKISRALPVNLIVVPATESARSAGFPSAARSENAAPEVADAKNVVRQCRVASSDGQAPAAFADLWEWARMTSEVYRKDEMRKGRVPEVASVSGKERNERSSNTPFHSDSPPPSGRSIAGVRTAAAINEDAAAKIYAYQLQFSQAKTLVHYSPIMFKVPAHETRARAGTEPSESRLRDTSAMPTIALEVDAAGRIAHIESGGLDEITNRRAPKLVSISKMEENKKTVHAPGEPRARTHKTHVRKEKPAVDNPIAAARVEIDTDMWSPQLCSRDSLGSLGGSTTATSTVVESEGLENYAATSADLVSKEKDEAQSCDAPFALLLSSPPAFTEVPEDSTSTTDTVAAQNLRVEKKGQRCKDISTQTQYFENTFTSGTSTISGKVDSASILKSPVPELRIHAPLHLHPVLDSVVFYPGLFALVSAIIWTSKISYFGHPRGSESTLCRLWDREGIGTRAARV
ncbi:hypothetical protein B0H13DRAFT_1930286 [Mycena leptocephala]|nr:hypothetical protein B0H13DRAFT_1930286 [Mycena leptocephala]